MRDLGLLTRWREINERADVFARADLARLFASPALELPVLTNATVALLEVREAPRLTPTDVAEVSAEVGRPGVGEGLARLAEIKPEVLSNRNTLRKLVATGAVLELDRHLATVGAAEATRVAGELEGAAGGSTIDMGAILAGRR
jgi:hypothetical protein